MKRRKIDTCECDGGCAAGGDAGAAASAGASGGEAASTGTTSAEVLGPSDHGHDGYMGPGCFHVPSKVMPTLHRSEILAGKKKRGHKNPYAKNLKINEMEMDRKTIRALHEVHEDVILAWIKWNFNFVAKQVIGIAYHPVAKTMFIKFKMPTGVTMFAEADFNPQTKRITKVGYKAMTVEQAKERYQEILSMPGNSPANTSSADIDLWVIWGQL